MRIVALAREGTKAATRSGLLDSLNYRTKKASGFRVNSADERDRAIDIGAAWCSTQIVTSSLEGLRNNAGVSKKIEKGRAILYTW